MKHSLKITGILLGMFVLAQLIGLAVNYAYTPQISTEVISVGNVTTIVNITTYNLPYGVEPPEDNEPKMNFISILIAFVLAIGVMLLLMKFRAELLLRGWFFLVITFGIAVSINAALLSIQYAAILSFILGLILAYFKVFQRNIIVHNVTELLVYPGISAIFVPLLNIWTVVFLLVAISFYDMYAVWHSGFIQNMAKYQIKKVRVFSGFFIPYIKKEDRALLEKLRKSKDKSKKIKVNIALLGGGDVVFPMILAGVVLQAWGLIPALIIILGAVLSLAYLFYISEKGKFYPAMPFISAGCLIALALGSLVK